MANTVWKKGLNQRISLHVYALVIFQLLSWLLRKGRRYLLPTWVWKKIFCPDDDGAFCIFLLKKLVGVQQSLLVQDDIYFLLIITHSKMRYCWIVYIIFNWNTWSRAWDVAQLIKSIYQRIVLLVWSFVLWFRGLVNSMHQQKKSDRNHKNCSCRLFWLVSKDMEQTEAADINW